MQLSVCPCAQCARSYSRNAPNPNGESDQSSTWTPLCEPPVLCFREQGTFRKESWLNIGHEQGGVTSCKMLLSLLERLLLLGRGFLLEGFS